MIHEFAPQSPDRALRTQAMIHELPHKAPIGALRTQAGVKRSETPVKSSRQQPSTEGTTEILSPLSGFQSARTSFAGVSLRSTTCLCSVAPIGACNNNQNKNDANKYNNLL